MPPHPDSGDEDVPLLTTEDCKKSCHDIDSDDADDDEIWNCGMEKCKDLFSDKEFGSALECLEYGLKIHKFSIKALKKRHSMDCFSYIRLINYVRRHQPDPSTVMAMTGSEWSDDCYMKPALPDDPMLMVDIDDDIGDDLNEEEESLLQSFKQLNVPGSNSSDREIADMGKTLDILRRQLEVKSQDLEAAVADMEKMRRVTQALVNGDGGEPEPANTAERSVSGRRTENEDSGYAGSYAHFGIHHEMLSDKVRTESYRDAVAQNVGTISDKTVLDLGCGTGILSMFCARLGHAKQVVGVDMSSIAHQAMDIVIENKLEDTVKIVKGRLEDTDLKAKVGFDKFDVLISEWMGYFLLFEGMLDSVMKARDTYLTPDALILPNRCTMHLVGVQDTDRYSHTAGYFEDVYGFKMSCLREPLIKEASVEVVPASKVITSDALIHNLDMNRCTLADTEFTADFELTVTLGDGGDGEMTAVAGYFDTFFDDPRLEKAVMFSTGPAAKPTHWKQTVFYLQKPLKVSHGQLVKGKIKVVRPDQDIRALRVTLSLEGIKEQLFHVE